MSFQVARMLMEQETKDQPVSSVDFLSFLTIREDILYVHTIIDHAWIEKLLNGELRYRLFQIT